MNMNRKDFREAVLGRDNHSCVWCDMPAQDAHHLMERRLFDDGGYVVNNGVSVCGPCHIKAEQTVISPNDLRRAAKIEAVVLPPHLYSDYKYDKWGNIVNPNGTRIRGELFFDTSVQKIIPQRIKELFIPYVKYPRTYHVPWTASTTRDDRIHASMSHFHGKEVVVTEKRDGENTTVYSDGYFHARSVDSASHPSQGRTRYDVLSWCYDLPTNWRVCGENLYALHSIAYSNLSAYFEVFSVWDERNLCLGWDDTVEWCALLGIETVPVLYRGVYDEVLIRNLSLDTEKQEGYVIRTVDPFSYSQFRHSTAKFVRRGHVKNTVHNWKRDWRPNMVNHLTGDHEEATR